MQPLCSFPWHYLLFGNNVFGPCCNYLFKHDKLRLTRDTVLELYHGADMRTLRSRLARHDIANTPCEQCLKNHGNMPEFPEFDAHPPLRAAARAVSEHAFAQASPEFDAPPLVYNLMTSLRCNLRCIMCYAEKPDHDRDGIDASSLLHALGDFGWDTVAELVLAGGEPFLTHDALRIIEAVASLPQAKPALRIYTNGLLLHKHQDLLARIDNLHLMVSFEATGADYEKIRVGGKWTRLLSNLRLISSLAGTKPDWRVTTTAVVMRSSLPHLAELVDLSRDLGFHITFGICRDNYIDENIFSFPHLLQDMPWQHFFDAAIRACGETFPETAAQLATLRQTLGENLVHGTVTMNSPAVASHDACLARQLDQPFGREQYVIFGTRTDLLSSLATHPVHDRLRGIYDFTAFSGKYCGYPLLPAQQLQDFSGNILVCSNTNHHGAHHEFLQTIAPDASVKFLFFWSDATDRLIDALVATLGNKPVVGFGTGGAASHLLAESRLQELSFVAFADNNPKAWGKSFLDRPVIRPQDILESSHDVVILSEAYQESIRKGLISQYGSTLHIHCIY